MLYRDMADLQQYIQPDPLVDATGGTGWKQKKRGKIYPSFFRFAEAPVF